MKKITIILLIIFSFGVTSVMAQGRTVSGKVTDSGSGEPVVGATIMVQGTSNGAYTMDGGKFVITNVDGAVNLETTFMGYTVVILPISASQTRVDIELTPSAMQMDEIVVVAYGTADKKSLTGSVAVISAEEIADRPMTNIASAISGMTPGVMASGASGTPGSSPEIRIRGIGSINSSSEPLYVVDGMPYAGNISDLSSDDIQSMSVLKDAASTALYGSKASNGVIMIQTKTGRKGKITFDVKINQGFVYRSIPEYDKIGAEDFYGLAWESDRNSQYFTQGESMQNAGKIATERAFGSIQWYNVLQDNTTGKLMDNNKVFQPQPWAGYSDQNWTRGAIHPDASMFDGYRGDMDWVDELLGIGHRQNYNISASGGTDMTSYFTSIGYTDEDSFYSHTSFSRLNARAKVDVTPTKWLKLGTNINASISKRAVPLSTWGLTNSNPLRFSRSMSPVYPVHMHDRNTGEYILDANGKKMFDMGVEYKDPITGDVLITPRGQEPEKNPLYYAENDIKDTDVTALTVQAYAQITFLKDFKLTIDGSLNNNYEFLQGYNNPSYGDGAPLGRSTGSSTRVLNTTFKQMLEWGRAYGKHNVSALVGHEYFQKQFHFLSASKTGEIFPGSKELDNFSTVFEVEGFSDKYLSEGFFGRANYNYDEKYYFIASYRRDGSSKFSPQNRWGDFWSVGATWIISQENFMSNAMWVDFLKFRVSYGTNGNDGGFSGINSITNNGVDYYQWLSRYSATSYNGNAALAMSTHLLPSISGSPDLIWETAGALDIGVDFRLFNKLTGSIGYFEKSSNELIFDVPVSTSSGISTIKQNVGSMVNRGVELALDVDAIRTKDWHWNIGLNISWMQNRITKLPGYAADVGIELSGSDQKLMTGHSIYEFYTYQFAGVDPQDGASYYHVDANQRSDNEFQIGDRYYTKTIGNAYRDFSGDALSPVSGAVSTSLTWKNLTLDLLFTFKIGGTAIDYSYLSMMQGSVNSAWSADMFNSWRKPGDISSLPRMETGNLNLWDVSSNSLIDNSGLALQNVTLSYVFPKKVANKLRLKGVSIYAVGENLFQISALKGYDAMASFGGVMDNTRIASTAVVSMGINISF